MKTTTSGLLALVLIICTRMPAYAQGKNWESLTAESTALYKQGRYDDAVAVAKEALDLAEKAAGPNQRFVAASLYILATLYQARGQYAQAEPLFKRNLAIVEKALGPDHPYVATSLNNLAGLYRAQASTRKPSRSSSARWRSGRRPWARIIPMWPRA